MVSAFLGKLGLEEFDPLNESFVCRTFDWEKIKKNAGEIHIYNSDDDPYVPLERGKKIARNLGIELTIIEKGGHINAGAGFTKIPFLLKDLKKILDDI